MNPAYFETLFILSLKKEEIPDNGFIITAWNPMDKFLPVLKNKKRNKSLLKKIKKEKLTLIPIIGTSPDGSHQEESFLINATKEKVIEWGKEFNQRAIYEIEEDNLIIIPCMDETEDIVSLGSFRERLLKDHEP